MNKRITAILVLLAIVAGVRLMCRDFFAQSAPPGPGGAPVKERTVGETFKNIQVFTDHKDAPAPDLYKAMQFMSGSLSVSCNYCHVSQQGPWASDENRNKLKAREMITMTRAINERSFGGRQVVTCNTCHRGSPQPIGVPSPWSKTSEEIATYNALVQRTAARPGASAATDPNLVLPDVDQVIAAYRKAVGLTNNLKSIRVSGTNVVAEGGSTSFEAIAVFPDKFLVRTTNRGNEIKEILNGDRGWRLTPQARIDLASSNLSAVKVRFESILSPVKFASSLKPRKVVGTEKIGDKTFYVLESKSSDQIEQLYFDTGSSLLYKQRIEVGTWFGTRVEERTFEDYRDVHGVKLAFLITNHYMEDESVFKISEIQSNAEIDPAQFEPPTPK